MGPTDLVRWFEDLDKDDVAVGGGKGANLGEMAHAGFPVPPGFVLTTAAYDLFVDANGLQPEIERLAAHVGPGDAQAAEEASQAIRSLFHQGRVPAAVAETVAAAYERLGGLVAVRSSATAEDLPGASFAGQQETFLHLEGREQVLAAVMGCWSSLWTARALSYRAREGISPQSVSLAVVVQRLVPAEVAGVLFTANPVNGRRDQTVVDATWGLGEALVSGQVTPDHWVVDTAGGTVVERSISRKAVRTVPRQDGTGGTHTAQVEAALQAQPALDEAGLQAVVDLGRRVSAHYGSPQDIEWAVAAGRLYLVQARPVTSLFPLPAPPPAPGSGLRVYVCGNVIQGLVEPLTPMGLSALGAFASGPARLFGFHFPLGEAPPAYGSAAGRIYVDGTNALRHPRTRAIILELTLYTDPPTRSILETLMQREPALAPNGPSPLHPPAGFMAKAATRVLWTLSSPDAARKRAFAHFDRLLSDLEQRAEAVADVDTGVKFIRETIPSVFIHMASRLLPVVVPGLGSRFLSERLLSRWIGDTSGMMTVLRSLPHNPTTEMDLALWRLSRRLKAEGLGARGLGTEGRQLTPDHPGVREFLHRYGHRAVREIDIGMPRWRDDPTQVLETLRTYLAQGEESNPEEQFRLGAVTAEKAAEELVARVRREKGWMRATLIRFLLFRVRKLAGLREYPKFVAVRTIAINRRVLQRVGQQLAEFGRIDHPDDVFFLTLADLETDGLDLRVQAAATRAEYQRELLRRSIPRVMTSTGEAFYGAPSTVEGALTGTPASAGVHEGRVRIVNDPKCARLEPGDVLVAPGTDPAWTPLFLTAGALVTEIGGNISHGSVVAREYGIPAVVGVVGATTLLKEGQRVRVDGEAGQVVPLE